MLKGNAATYQRTHGCRFQERVQRALTGFNPQMTGPQKRAMRASPYPTRSSAEGNAISATQSTNLSLSRDHTPLSEQIPQGVLSSRHLPSLGSGDKGAQEPKAGRWENWGRGQASEARHNGDSWSWPPPPDPQPPTLLIQSICPSWGNTDGDAPSPDRDVLELVRISSRKTSTFKDFAGKLLNTAIIKN